MSKISFLSIIFLSVMLSSCGFHAPYKSQDINVNIIGNTSNEFVTALSSHLNKDTGATLNIKISDETKTKKNASFDSSGNVKSYTLGISVDVEVLDSYNTLIMKEQLFTSSHHTAMSSTQADTLQSEEAYSNLRETIIKKLLRRLHRLNES
ncbi:MAG TPA: hypothetical protein EYG35_00955 [Gammaproteobacteria bacterium]|jgi:LPS-assembly lipoprotein|nr:hypothetical protein [Gammaproteobacteria bacterium]